MVRTVQNFDRFPIVGSNRVWQQVLENSLRPPGVGFSPVRRPEWVVRCPEAPTVPAGSLLGGLQIGWRGEPIEDPGVALGNQLKVEIALVNPEGT